MIRLHAEKTVLTDTETIRRYSGECFRPTCFRPHLLAIPDDIHTRAIIQAAWDAKEHHQKTAALLALLTLLGQQP